MVSERIDKHGCKPEGGENEDRRDLCLINVLKSALNLVWNVHQVLQKL